MDFLALDVIHWRAGKVCPTGSFLGRVRNIRLGTRKSGNIPEKDIVGHPFFLRFYDGDDAVVAGEVGSFGEEVFGGAHEVGGFICYHTGVFAVGRKGDDLENWLSRLKFGSF